VLASTDATTASEAMLLTIMNESPSPHAETAPVPASYPLSPLQRLELSRTTVRQH
jgi:hypothetical protein